ncbi:MAG TPA: hypothetical protein VLL73_07015, partial [Desulfurivibrionaceae bacterium]|nr:hypothetical protein [Desulfurivibrionaceae bacterium]
ISILTSFEDAPQGMKRVSIRITTDKEAEVDALHQDLIKNFTVVFYGVDELKNMPRRTKAAA